MTDSPDLFTEITRIEKQADEIIESARAEARQTVENARQEAMRLAEKTDREIEQARKELADEHEKKTGQALTQIDVEFLKDEEALDSVREDHFDELVEWAATRLREHLKVLTPNGH